jgi:gamma-glutamylcyclotransferase (GGCT)/AIG2-like uncharacterized protein YtfP
MMGRLYDLGRYPGVMRARSNGKRVFGELYEIADGDATGVLRRLDRYEGPEYDRTKVFVTLRNGRRRTAWVYVLKKEPALKREVESGRYRRKRGAA